MTEKGGSRDRAQRTGKGKEDGRLWKKDIRQRTEDLRQWREKVRQETEDAGQGT